MENRDDDDEVVLVFQIATELQTVAAPPSLFETTRGTLVCSENITALSVPSHRDLLLHRMPKLVDLYLSNLSYDTLPISEASTYNYRC